MKVVQAVFGVFHHFELAHQLRRRGHLQRIYSTWPWARLQREGLPKSFVRTSPYLHTAHYLMGQTGRVSPKFLSTLGSWTTLAFDRYTLSRIAHEECDAFLAISGAGLLTGAEVQRRGGVFVCDRGSTHQRFQTSVMQEEYRRWKLPLPLAEPHILPREEAIYDRADAITVPSTVAKRSFVEMGVPAEKVHVIPYGVRLDRFSPTEEPPQSETFHVLFAGGVSLRKGVPYLLRAFAALRHPHKRLTVVGHMSDEIRSLLPSLPTDDVTFTGSLPQPELARIMARSHVLVLPSVEEGLALVQGQAMACGCPVIATAATGAEDLFTDSVEGFILHPARGEDPTEGLSGKMQRLADDPGLQNMMRSAALARVRQIGGWDQYGDLWESLLLRLTRR